ncbi:MAG: alkaline phosphatase PhoX, partial [Myxococcota bacterium]
ATAPVAAEFTGPKFTPDGRTLLLAVQHPGETTRSPDHITSHWPDGGDAMPACAVIALSGPLLDRLVASAANA